MRALLVGMALALALLAPARVDACSCKWATTRVLAPQPGWQHDALAPIVTTGTELPSVTLQDSSGSPIALHSELVMRPLSLCGASHAVWRPEVPLVEGASYVLNVSDSRDVLPPMELVATGTHYPKRAVVASITLQHEALEPHLSSEAGCASPKLNDHLVVGSFNTEVTLDTFVPVVLELRLSDSALGSLSDYGSSLLPFQSYRLGRQTSWTGSTAKLSTTDDCVDLLMRDYAGQVVWSESACPQVGETFTFTADFEATQIPDGENPGPIDTVAGGGCSASGRGAPTGAWWLVALIVMLRRAGRGDLCWRPGEGPCPGRKRHGPPARDQA